MSLRGEDALILAMDYTEQTLKGQGALKGEDGFSPVITENTNTGDVYKLDITTKDGKITTPNLVGKQGIQGEIGPQGKPADNPIVSENADNTEEIYKLDLTVGETVFTTRNIQGKQGLEGVSPSVTTNPDNTAEDYRLNITTKGGTFTTPNLRGPIGPQGEQGESAASAINPRGDYDVNADPHYTISDYITSAEGNTYVCKKDNPNNVAPTDGTVNDEFWQILALRGAQGLPGRDGEKGADGVTFTPSIDENGILSFTNNGGLENPNPIDIKGDNGVTFTPSIDAEGYLSFTNNSNLENPEPIKVLGQDGADGKDGIDGTTYIPSIGTVTTVESNADASAGVTVDEETKEAVFHFEIPKGKQAVQFTPSITENGELAWENDGDLPNPPTTPIQTLISTAPLGTVLSFAGSNAPNGYLLCDGASYKVADYEDLYAVIGNTYGGDDTNFNVPNLIDKFIQGSNTSGTEKEAGLPNITGELVSLNAGTSNFKDTKFVNGAFSADTKWNAINGNGTLDSYGEVSFDASRSNAIYGNSDTVQPPALTMVYIIKAFHTNEGQDEGVSDSVVDYVDGKIIDTTTSTDTVWSSKKTSDELKGKLFTKQIAPNSLGFDVDSTVTLEEFFRAIYNKYGTSGTLGFWWSGSNEIYVEHNGTKVKINGGIFTWQSTNINIGWQHITAIYAPNSSTNTMYKMFFSTGEEAGNIVSQGIEVIPTLSDTSSTTSTYSSSKIDEKYGAYTFGTAGATQWLKLTLGNSSKFQAITITDQYGGKVEITGMADDGTYKPVKLVRYSYGDWTTYSATDYTSTDAGDANYKIRRLFYYPAGSCYYLEIRQYCTIKVSGATTRPEMVTSLPVDTSAMTLIPESNWGRIDDSNLTSETSTWSSSKIASEIVGKKTQYRGSRSIDISTGGNLTLIYSSEYASQAGCYMLLSNYNTTPLLIELGRTNIGAFNVTATNKSFGVDTITVTTAGDEYSWYVLQF